MDALKMLDTRVVGLVNDLTGDEFDVLTDSDFRKALKRRIAAYARTVAMNTFFFPLRDEDVTTLFPEDRREVVAAVTAGMRRAATDMGCSPNWPVARRVRQGYQLKKHPGRTGECYNGWKGLQGWSLKNDLPTVDGVAFWVPRLVPASTDKTVDEQIALAVEFRERYKLPAHFLPSRNTDGLVTGYGSAAVLTGCILHHKKTVGERTPLDCLWSRTDTLDSDGRGLGLGCFGEGGLGCGYWSDALRRSLLGFFPGGWEPLVKAA